MPPESSRSAGPYDRFSAEPSRLNCYGRSRGVEGDWFYSGTTEAGCEAALSN